jgi:hypothetical protein
MRAGLNHLDAERMSLEAVSLLMKAARLRNHADELEKDRPSDPESAA